MRILATTDLHLNVLPYDYFSDRKLPHLGLAKAAKLVKALRHIDAVSLLFDNGDFLQGNPLSDWVANDSDFSVGDLHPMIAAMNVLGYDGATLGNHDFNYGLEFLENAIAKANFPYVSANLTRSQGATPTDDTTIVAPWRLLERTLVTADGQSRSLQIGIIGFAPPQTPVWEQSLVGDQLGARDIIETAKAYVPQMRAAGADIIIALAHSGLGSGEDIAGEENAALTLASVPGIDAIISGHTHQVFPSADMPIRAGVDPAAGTLHHKPAVMAGCFGSHVGVIDLKLEHSDAGWSVAAFCTAAVGLSDLDAVTPPDAKKNEPIGQDGMDADVVSSIKDAHSKVVALLQQQIGNSSAHLHSYLSLIGHCPASQVLADAMRRKASKKLRGTKWQGLPLAIAVAPSRSGGQIGPDNYIDIPAGPLLRRHAAELYHFPNTLCVLALKGADIRNWLEWSARMFLAITPGLHDQLLIDPDSPGYNFDTLFGLTYEIDPSQPAATAPQSGDGKRISKLCLQDGSPITADQDILLATNNYRASGGGGYEMASLDDVVVTCKVPLRDIAVEHFQSGPIDAATAQVWRFSHLPDTSALFESSKMAQQHLSEMPSNTLQDAGPGHDGFHSFRLLF